MDQPDNPTTGAPRIHLVVGYRKTHTVSSWVSIRSHRSLIPAFLYTFFSPNESSWKIHFAETTTRETTILVDEPITEKRKGYPQWSSTKGNQRGLEFCGGLEVKGTRVFLDPLGFLRVSVVNRELTRYRPPATPYIHSPNSSSSAQNPEPA